MTGNVSNDPLWQEHLSAGAHWSGIVRRGITLRITALQSGANLSATLFNADQPLERYNMADTLKAQHTAFVTKGHVLYSDMGRVMCSLVDDRCGWHDTISGVSNAMWVRQRYGATSFQQHRNDYYKNAKDSLLVELGKYGLSARDLGCTVNFFSKVVVDDVGQLQFVNNHCKAGDYVDLRFEMNTLLVVSSCQHRLDPDPHYQPREVLLVARNAEPVTHDDVCRNSCPENQRGFYNTEVLYR
jgi:uncharacterized protein